MSHLFEQINENYFLNYLNFKLKIVAEAEAVKNRWEIAHEYGICESMVRKWRNQQHMLFNGELKMTAKRANQNTQNWINA